MKTIILDRGKGKTEELIKISQETGHYIVCHNQHEARVIASRAAELGYYIPFPITHDDFIDRKYFGRGIKGFLIDNVDILLESISRVPITAITLTQNDNIKLPMERGFKPLLSEEEMTIGYSKRVF